MKNNMKIIILVLAVIMCIAIGYITFNYFSSKDVENKIYVLTLNYDNGKVKLLELFVKNGHSPDRKVQPENGYNCELVSKNNEILYSFKFSIPLTVMTPPPVEGDSGESTIYLENTNFTLLIPYFKNCEKIVIYDPDYTELISIDVSYFDSMIKTEIPLNYIYIFIGIIVVLIIIFSLCKILGKRNEWNSVYQKWKGQLKYYLKTNK